jgi:hypothetical protein
MTFLSKQGVCGAWTCSTWVAPAGMRMMFELQGVVPNWQRTTTTMLCEHCWWGPLAGPGALHSDCVTSGPVGLLVTVPLINSEEHRNEQA